MSAKGDRSDGRSRGPALGIGRRGYRVARPRSDAWLWILNAVVISLAGVAAAAVSTNIGHTVVAATYHFLLFYVGVLALLALTAEVGIGLVATDRIVMKPSARVTAQALHRAMGFGAMAFLIIHIILEIVVGRSQVADAVVPFLDKERTFYLGLGTVASDMFVVIVMFGIFRARLSDRITPARGGSSTARPMSPGFSDHPRAAGRPRGNGVLRLRGLRLLVLRRLHSRGGSGPAGALRGQGPGA